MIRVPRALAASAAIGARALLAALAAPGPVAAQWEVLDNSGHAFAESVFPAGGFLPSVRDEHTFGPRGGAAAGEVDIPPFGRMRAVQLGSGLNAVGVVGRVGDLAYFDFRAGTDIGVSVRNVGASTLPLLFTYHINGGELRLYDPGERFDGLTASVSVSIFTIAPGFSGFLWSWSLSLRGSRGVVTPSVDFLLDPLGFGVPALGAVSIAGGEAVLPIAPFSAGVDLGPVDPGDRALVTYTMDAFVLGPGFNATGGLARLGDPFGFDGDPGAGIGFGGVDLQAGPAAVPEPSTLALAAAGLAALASLAAGRVRGSSPRAPQTRPPPSRPRPA